MAKIIGIIQVKGGVGRSTLATNLAALLSERLKTVLVDCDMPQGTAASWYSLRQQERPTESLTLTTTDNHTGLTRVIEQLNESHELIVIDAPPRIAEITRAILILADLCLIPLGTSAAEIWATTDLLSTIEEAKKVKRQVDARIVWTRFRPTTRSAQELSEAVHRELKLQELKSKLGLRVAYSDALAQGRTVMEWPDPAARKEITALSNEVWRILARRK